MRKYQSLLALLSLIILPWQVVAAIDDSIGFVFQAGNNIPVSYTATATTTALGEIVLQVSHTLGAGGAGCGAVALWTAADPSAGPGFPVSPGSYTIYLNTSTLDIGQKNMKKDSCPSVHDNGFMGIEKVSVFNRGFAMMHGYTQTPC